MLKLENINTVAIIGAGFIGPGIAQVFRQRISGLPDGRETGDIPQSYQKASKPT